MYTCAFVYLAGPCMFLAKDTSKTSVKQFSQTAKICKPKYLAFFELVLLTKLLILLTHNLYKLVMQCQNAQFVVL